MILYRYFFSFTITVGAVVKASQLCILLGVFSESDPVVEKEH